MAKQKKSKAERCAKRGGCCRDYVALGRDKVRKFRERNALNA
jgi:hypothetical protein